MNRNENDTQPDFRKLAEQYASFFTALGGVCITVLTLILALERVPNIADLHSVLIASLVVATAVSFIGAHLMAETAASIRQSASSVDTSSPPRLVQEKETSPWVGGRLFLLASINIYLAVILTSFSLMLLPAAYDKLNARDITLITFIVFLVVLGSAFDWMHRYFVFRIRPLELEGEQKPPQPSLRQKVVVIVVSLAAGGIFFLPLDDTMRKHVQAGEFILLIALSAGSGFYFNRIYHQKQQPVERDWKRVSCFFYTAITFSCITICALGIRLIILPSFFSW